MTSTSKARESGGAVFNDRVVRAESAAAFRRALARKAAREAREAQTGREAS